MQSLYNTNRKQSLTQILIPLLAVCLSVTFFIIVLIFIYYQGMHHLWEWHLAYDCRYNYYPKAKYFFDYNGYTGMGNNERQPGELVFLSILSLVFYFDLSENFFLTSLMCSNIILCIVLGIVVYRSRGIWSLNILSLILFSFGPISLFRMELLTCLIMILGLLAWERRAFTLSMFYLSLATVTKIFPVFILPYLIITSLRANKLLATSKIFFAYILFLIFYIFLFIQFYQVGVSFLMDSWQFHVSKPVHIESLLGTITSAWSYLFSGIAPKELSAYGIFGIQEEYLIFPQLFYDNIWIVLFLIAYSIIIFRNKNLHLLRWEAVILLLLTFLLFVKTLTPQYLLWFVLLVPLVKRSYFRQRKFFWLSIIILVLFVGVTTQYVFPVRYSALIEFYKTNHGPEVFYVLLVRNLALLALWLSVMKHFIRSK